MRVIIEGLSYAFKNKKDLVERVIDGVSEKFSKLGAASIHKAMDYNDKNGIPRCLTQGILRTWKEYVGGNDEIALKKSQKALRAITYIHLFN
jgi:hypothetical protein